MAGGKASARNLELSERRYKAFELRKAGASYRAIAEKMRTEFDLERYNESAAHKDVLFVLDQTKEQTAQSAEQYRAMELDRLDTAQLAIAQQVRQGHLGAIDRWIRLTEQRAKLLGLYPEKQKQMPVMEAIAILMAEGVASPDQAAVVAEGMASIREKLRGLNGTPSDS